MNMNMNFFTPITYWILALESGKRLWRKLEPEFNFKEDGDVYGDICINGVLYFEGKLEGSFVIVCFDVRSEKFSFINKDEDMLPKPSAYYTGHSTLFNYKDKLGSHRVEQELVLWVLEDAGNHKWSKHSYVLSSPLEEKILVSTKFVGMTRTGELVYSWNSCVWFYNIERNTVKRVYIQGLGGLKHPSFCRTIVDYVENLRNYCRF
ncbi:hypothetical protein DY000_02009757 [Brassica cretica]|uniref:F-box associated beta-propeller type 3 domain-containing protein n=1 Tax=Brassica cretica TaxID=69181 RepID=A0ABQ7BYP3_BRACR|nr:hypothetical protein DY000_02009757 [Brassica cretica]